VKYARPERRELGKLIQQRRSALRLSITYIFIDPSSFLHNSAQATAVALSRARCSAIRSVKGYEAIAGDVGPFYVPPNAPDRGISGNGVERWRERVCPRDPAVIAHLSSSSFLFVPVEADRQRERERERERSRLFQNKFQAYARVSSAFGLGSLFGRR